MLSGRDKAPWEVVNLAAVNERDIASRCGRGGGRGKYARCQGLVGVAGTSCPDGTVLEDRAARAARKKTGVRGGVSAAVCGSVRLVAQPMRLGGATWPGTWASFGPCVAQSQRGYEHRQRNALCTRQVSEQACRAVRGAPRDARAPTGGRHVGGRAAMVVTLC